MPLTRKQNQVEGGALGALAGITTLGFGAMYAKAYYEAKDDTSSMKDFNKKFFTKIFSRTDEERNNYKSVIENWRSIDKEFRDDDELKSHIQQLMNNDFSDSDGKIMEKINNRISELSKKQSTSFLDRFKRPKASSEVSSVDSLASKPSQLGPDNSSSIQSVFDEQRYSTNISSASVTNMDQNIGMEGDKVSEEAVDALSHA